MAMLDSVRKGSTVQPDLIAGCPEDLCMGCGLCAAVCPNKLLEMQRDARGFYIPAEKGICDRACGLCISVCPGVSVDFAGLNRHLFGKQSKNWLLGNNLHCYMGHSTDPEILQRASSGGIVSTLANGLLTRGVVDAVVLTRMGPRNPLEPEVVIARNKHEVISASGSKYCPINLADGVRYILNHEGRYALVGLPCHIHGIRKAERAIPKLAKRVLLHVGLFCNHTVSFLGTEFLLQKMELSTNQVTSLSYRSKGWSSGGMTVRLRDGKEGFLPKGLYWSCFFAHFFISQRCNLCPDQTNELADISVGDAWLPHLRGRQTGESVMLSRTEFGEAVMRQAMTCKEIEALQTDEQTIVESQKATLAYKKKLLSARRSLMCAFRRKVPVAPPGLPAPKAIALAGAIIPYVWSGMSNRAFFLRMLKHVPLRALQLYDMVVGVLNDA